MQLQLNEREYHERTISFSTHLRHNLRKCFFGRRLKSELQLDQQYHRAFSENIREFAPSLPPDLAFQHHFWMIDNPSFKNIAYFINHLLISIKEEGISLVQDMLGPLPHLLAFHAGPREVSIYQGHDICREICPSVFSIDGERNQGFVDDRWVFCLGDS